jgi:hypothetical protein
MGASIAYKIGEFVIVTDSVFKFLPQRERENSLHIGAEYFVMKQYPLRLGYSYLFQEKRNEVSLGVGLVGAKIGLDLGFRQEIKKKGETIFSLALRFFLN